MPYRTVNFTEDQEAEIKAIQEKNPLVSEATVIRMAVTAGLPHVRNGLTAIRNGGATASESATEA